MAFSMSTISALVAFSSSTMAFARDHTFLEVPHEVSLKAGVPDATLFDTTNMLMRANACNSSIAIAFSGLGFDAPTQELLKEKYFHKYCNLAREDGGWTEAHAALLAKLQNKKKAFTNLINKYKKAAINLEESLAGTLIYPALKASATAKVTSAEHTELLQQYNKQGNPGVFF